MACVKPDDRTMSIDRRPPPKLPQSGSHSRPQGFAMADNPFPLPGTLRNGAYAVDEPLLGNATQQLLRGHHVSTRAPVLIACNLRGSHHRIDELRSALSYQLPGVFELGLVGGFDRRGEQDDPCTTGCAIVEHVTRGTWLPRLLPPMHAPQAAKRMAIELGLTAGRILARAATAGVLLVRIRPEYLWANCTSGHWKVTGLSARGDELLRHETTDIATPPLFDRDYHAPEWQRDPDHRALVFTLAVMIAEWTMGRHPFERRFHDQDLEQQRHLPIEASVPLKSLLEESLQLDRRQRPQLGEFLAALAMLAFAAGSLP
jgi:hypothetical protein